jgi:hypothetical protein
MKIYENYNQSKDIFGEQNAAADRPMQEGAQDS